MSYSKFNIILNGRWCQYSETETFDLEDVKSFVGWGDQMGYPHKFYLKSGGYLYVHGYVAKQIKQALNARQSEIDQLKAEKAGLEKDIKSSQALSTLRARTLSSFKEKIEDLEAKLLEQSVRGEHE